MQIHNVYTVQQKLQNTGTLSHLQKEHDRETIILLEPLSASFNIFSLISTKKKKTKKTKKTFPNYITRNA